MVFQWPNFAGPSERLLEKNVRGLVKGRQPSRPELQPVVCAGVTRCNVDERVAEIIFPSFSLQWILDKQDLLKERQKDLKFLTEEEYWKLQIFFTNGKTVLFLFLP